jgi:alkanesulfonate monooxygenase SsuD/methylene tetrahydromethanopterin reductase-like flavin-dependent oxidoreductase (luciferase family)
MTDYGHDLLFGTFITPTADPPLHAVEMAKVSERAGFDLATFQDHPYQAAFHDTWTLLAYVAAQTSRIRVTGNVLNLPLRQPAVLARSAASLDRLSGGRFEMGLGAGAFQDAIEAMGGERRTPGQSIQALEEAILIMREIWDTSQRGGVRINGTYYQVNGAKRGPAPAHDIGIWLGAYKPRILNLTGRAADGWLPSLSYLRGGPAELAEMNHRIDEGAVEAGRDPKAIRRLLNISGQFASENGGPFVGPPDQWIEEMTDLALTYGISGFIVPGDSAFTIERIGEEIIPAVRERVAEERMH